MDLRLSGEEEKFRRKIVSFINDVYPRKARQQPSPAEIERWHQAVVDKGWTAPELPPSAGGTGWSQTEIFLWYAATAEFNCPAPPGCGLQLVAPLLLEFGNENQRQLLENILNRTESWGNALFFAPLIDGSASLMADDSGDGYRLSGRVPCFSKPGCDHLLLLANTGEGQSLFLVSVHLVGITFEASDGAPDFRTVIFNDALPGQDALLGEINMAAKYLEFLIVERPSLSQVAHLESSLVYLKEVVARFGLQSEMESQIAGIEIEFAALKVTALRYRRQQKELQIVVVKGLDLARRINDSMINALGYYSLPSEATLPGSNEPPLVISDDGWKSGITDILPGCPEGFRLDLIARTLLA